MNNGTDIEMEYFCENAIDFENGKICDNGKDCEN